MPPGVSSPQFDSMFRTLSLALAAVVGFAFIYLLSFTPVYIDGDDASIVSYHILGRDSNIQPVYAGYMSMFDAALSLLPPDEHTVRIAAAIATAICGPLFFYLIMLLAFDWNSAVKSSAAPWVTALAMLLAGPELFYMALVVNPSLAAMTVVTAAHVFIRRYSHSSIRPPLLAVAASCVLFAVGAALRWDCILYGGVIAVDLLLRAGDRAERSPSWGERLRLATGWGTLAAVCWLVAIIASRGGVNGLLSVISQSGPGESLDARMFLVRGQPLFTPAFLLFVAAGFVSVWRSRNPLVWITPLSLLLTAKLILYGVPKWFIVAIPALMACAVAGFAALVERGPVFRAAVAGLLFLPWLVGIQIGMAGSTLGPGFQVRRYDQAHKGGSRPSAVLDSGVAIPTPEGHRPLWGHMWVLSGQWRRFVTENDAEQKHAVREAIQRSLPLLQDRGQGLAIASAAALGLTTIDPAETESASVFEVDRRFNGLDGRTFRMIRLRSRAQLFSDSGREQLRRELGSTVVIYGYSSTLQRIYQATPDLLQPLGNTAAILHLAPVPVHAPLPAPDRKVTRGSR